MQDKRSLQRAVQLVELPKLQSIFSMVLDQGQKYSYGPQLSKQWTLLSVVYKEALSFPEGQHRKNEELLQTGQLVIQPGQHLWLKDKGGKAQAQGSTLF